MKARTPLYVLIPICLTSRTTNLLLTTKKEKPADPPFSPIGLFTVNFSRLHYNVIQRGCEAISD